MTIRRRLIAVGFGAVAGTLLGVLVCAAVVVVKARSQSDGQTRIIFPHALINGQAERLVLDTGASVALFTQASAEKLGVKIDVPTSQSSFNVGENKAAIAVSAPIRIVVGDANFTTPIPVMNFPLSPFDGLFGWPEVRDNILVFDSGNRTVRGVAQLPPETAGWVKLKIHEDSLLLLESPQPDGSTGEISIDTGSDSGVALSPTLWEAWKKTHPKAAISTKTFAMPGTNLLHGEEAWADKVSLGPVDLTQVPVSGATTAESNVSDQYIGTLGMDALERMDLVVDYRGGYAYLKPKPPAQTPAKGAPPPHDWTVDKSVQLNVGPLYDFSAEAKGDQLDFAGKLADLNHAVELDPKDADLYDDRGETKANLGDYDGALADFDAAMKIDPKNAVYCADRAETKARHRDFTGALDDYAHAIELDPKNDYIYESRAIAREYQDDFAGALTDYDQAIGLTQDENLYPHLYREILQLRLGKAPADFKDTVAKWKKGWAKSLGQFLLGEIDEAALLKAAQTKDDEPVIGQQCEADYFIGVRRLFHGDTTGARKSFEQCIATGVTDYYEYHFAKAELARLDAAAKK